MSRKRVSPNVLRMVALAMLVALLASTLGAGIAAGGYGCGGWLYYGSTVYESLSGRGYSCSYSFDGTAGNVVTIQMVKRNYALDPYLTLYDPYGYVVASDDDSAGNSNSRIVYRLYDTGTYEIVAGSYGGSSYGPFMLTLSAR